MAYFTKKEFTTICVIMGAILFIAGIFSFIHWSNHYNATKVTPEQIAKCDEAHRVAEATKRLIEDDNLWNSAGNEALLISNTMEEGVNFSVYALYRTEDDKTYESIITSGSYGSIKNATERETVKYKLHHALAASTVSSILRKEEHSPEVVGVILNWEDPESKSTYSLIDMNADGSWDYLNQGKEVHFAEKGKAYYTDDIGNSIYTDASNPKEIIGSHIGMAEAVKLF